MKENVILKFNVDNVTTTPTHDDRFLRATIEAFADGPNAHTLPVSFDLLKKRANTIYDIPILCKYSRNFDDFEGHEEDEIPIGFIKESTANYSNPVRFEKKSDGRTFLVVDGLIWTQYSGESLNVLERDKKKGVSVELTCSGPTVNGKIDMDDFTLQGVTILGDFVRPAVKGANLQIQFSHDKENFLSSLKFEDSIKINNNKESAVSGAWSNPRQKLFTPISNASNSTVLLKEAYLVTDFSTEEPEITRFKYPHHVIKNGELVLQINGLKAAFQRASQQGIVEGEIKAHLLRHYRELGLSTENFAEFGMTREEFREFFSEILKESAGENMADTMDKNMENNVEVPLANTNPIEDEDKKINNQDYPDNHDDDHDNDDHDDDDHDDDCDKDDQFCDNPPEGKIVNYEDMEKNMEDLRTEIEGLRKEKDELKRSNDAYMAKLDAMCDYDDLVAFKSSMEEKMKQEKALSDMMKVIKEIEERGINMSDEDKDELINKYSDYSSFEAWANFAKAQIFDRADSLDGIARIGLPHKKNDPSSSIWGNPETSIWG